MYPLAKCGGHRLLAQNWCLITRAGLFIEVASDAGLLRHHVSAAFLSCTDFGACLPAAFLGPGDAYKFLSVLIPDADLDADLDA